jgi:hypothetical protein
MNDTISSVNPIQSATRFGVSENVSRTTLPSCETQPHGHVDRFLELSAMTGKA